MTLSKYYHNCGEDQQAEHCLAACGALCGLFTDAVRAAGDGVRKGIFGDLTVRSMEVRQSEERRTVYYTAI